MKLTVDVISDVICPWCYIGKRRLDKAIAALDDERDVQVRWHPFLLNPTMPKEGLSRREYRTRKFGSWERSLELDAQVIAAGETEGIQFAFDKVERTPNTIAAHGLIWLAGQHGCQDSVVESLFHAYFSEGRDIGNPETLVEMAADTGLGQFLSEFQLGTDDAIGVITEAAELSRERGISGVPFFIINDKLTLSGAQLPMTFLEALRKATGEA